MKYKTYEEYYEENKELIEGKNKYEYLKYREQEAPFEITKGIRAMFYDLIVILYEKALCEGRPLDAEKVMKLLEEMNEKQIYNQNHNEKT